MSFSLSVACVQPLEFWMFSKKKSHYSLRKNEELVREMRPLVRHLPILT